jgi:hemerythrin
MREHDYPFLLDHHREHALLLVELQDYIHQLEVGSRQIDYESLTALKHWLIRHVTDGDLAFARYLAQE